MNKLQTLLKKENLPYVPLAAVGVAIGIAEYFVYPWIEETAQKVGKTAMAHIEYLSTDEN